jgi:hypothetical protein
MTQYNRGYLGAFDESCGYSARRMGVRGGVG